MECSVCRAFNREHSRECETEATATLKQRARPVGSVHSPHHELEHVILGSRKRQAHIASQLQGHKEDFHTDQADKPEGLRKTAVA
jgi:hypothetical protein